MKFRKKPVVIEAHAYTGPEVIDTLLHWINTNGGEAHRNVRRSDLAVVIVIETLEGDMAATQGDWIIRGTHGEFYPCKPEIFDASYEPADGPGQTETPAHLEPTITDRGFKWMPAIDGTHHGRVVVYESSNASSPHVWLKASDEGIGESKSVHLPLAAASQLAEQIQYLAANHYQGAAAVAVTEPGEATA